MKIKILILLLLAGAAYVYFDVLNLSPSEPKSFNQSKSYVIDVYKGNEKTFYCDCDYTYTEKPSGRVDLNGCGYEIRNPRGELKAGTIERANRIEYEHVFPASWYGQSLQCWQDGGRQNCSNDKYFKIMESDIINLVPAIGQVNGDRSNLEFGIIDHKVRPQYGLCDFKVNFRDRVVEPREEIRGEIARILFYMHDAYDVKIDSNRERMLLSWHQDYPVSEWEAERNKRIMALIGRDNPYVSGEKEWIEGQELTGFMLMDKGDSGFFNFTKDDFNNIMQAIRRFL